jgi:peptidoglycan/LPS O-acetylase OafA/YrhL
MPNEINWSLLAGLRITLATIVCGAHLVWFKRDAISTGLEMFGGKAAVVGFLLVSGFSIAASLDRDESGFYFRRFKRIYPMYFFAVLSGIVLEVWLGNFQLPMYELEARGAATAIGNILMLQMFVVKSVAFNGVVWSLAVESAFYLASPFLKRASLLTLAALMVISATFYLMPIKFDGGWIYTMALKANVVKYFWPFATGFILYFNRDNLLAAILLLMGSLLVWFSPINNEPLAVVTFVLSFSVVLLSRSGKLRSSEILDRLGDISYSLYLLQLPVFVLCYKVFGFISPAFLLASAFVVAAVAYELIDVRFKRWIFSALLKRDSRVRLRA